jgi:hypothetical protein
MTHVAWILYFVVWAVVIGIVWAMCRVAAKPTPKPQTCTRRAPHECAVNGPCNGFPKRGTYANGRPTLPSEVEPELEMERRTR